MNNNEAVEKLRAYLKCQENKVKGINALCNPNLCDDCDLCYMQGTTSEHLTSIELAIQALEKLKEYQQLEEQDRLIKLPCKIGTKVYNTTWWYDVREKAVVEGKTYYRTIHKHKVSKSTFGYWDINEFGKTVFLTRKEAEAKLKELRGEENESSN